MHQLGSLFFQEYYRVILNEKWTVVVCAVREDGTILGFHSGTLKAEEYSRALRRRRIRLGVASLPAVVAHPSLLKKGLARLRSLSADKDSEQFVVTEGPRGEYWAWTLDVPSGANAINCHVRWHEVMRSLGARYVRAEVDCDNPQILQTAIRRGATIVRKFPIPDGRERWEIEYRFDHANG